MRASSLLPTTLAALSCMTAASAKHAVSLAPLAPRDDNKNGPPAAPAAAVVQDKDKGTVTATLPSGDCLTVYLHGATITSWKTKDGDEKLFMSTASALDGSAPIRGGIPIMFPNYGTPPKDHQTSELPSHGFARNSTWAYHGSNDQAADGVELIFALNQTQLSNDYRIGWPHAFQLFYCIRLWSDNLAVHFIVQNNDHQAIDLQFLLHTYLAVPDITTASITGLKGAVYKDKTLNYTVFTETADELKIVKETDRIYTPPSVDTPLALLDNGRPRVVLDREPTLPDVVIWNIWSEKISSLKTMKDLEPKTAWQHYVAIEPGSVSKFTSLAPGDTWEGGVSYCAEQQAST